MKTIDVPVFRTHEYDVVVGGNGINGTIVLHNPYHVSTKVLSLSHIGIAIGSGPVDIDYIRNISANAIGIGLTAKNLSVRRNNEAVEITPTTTGIKIGTGAPRLQSTSSLSPVVSGIGLSTQDVRLGTVFEVSPSTIGMQLDTGNISATSGISLSPMISVFGIETLDADLETNARVIHYTDSTVASDLALPRATQDFAAAAAGGGPTSNPFVLFAGGRRYSSGSTMSNNSVVTKYTHELVRSDVTALGTARYALAGVTGYSNQRFFAVFAGGGTSNTSFNKSVDTYNYNALKTSDVASLSQSRSFLAGAPAYNEAHSQTVEFFGGGSSGSSSFSNNVDMYHFDTLLTGTASLSVARTMLSAGTTSNSTCVVFGGGKGVTENNTGYKSAVDAFDSSGSAITPSASLYEAGDYVATANAGDYLLFAGGYGKINDSSTNLDSITPYDSTLTRGIELHLPVATSCHAGATLEYNGKKYAIFAGGETNTTDVFMNNVAVYNYNLVRIDSGNLSLATSRGYFVSAVTGEYAIFAGGKSATNTTSTTVDVFQITG